MQKHEISQAERLEELISKIDAPQYRKDHRPPSPIGEPRNIKPPGVRYTKARKGASLDDFFAMIHTVVTRVMKKDNVEFLPDDGPRSLLDPAVQIDHPLIYYNLISREPMEKEPKPRPREEIVDTNADGTIARQGTIWGQRFNCRIQFNIVASDYTIANRVMNAFEELMFKYTGYFKENGVSELLFSRQFTDSTLDIYRQKMSVRSLVYSATIEKIHIVYDTTLQKPAKNHVSGKTYSNEAQVQDGSKEK